MSRAYKYVKNQYMLGEFSDEDLITLVNRGVITDEERLMIMNGQ